MLSRSYWELCGVGTWHRRVKACEMHCNSCHGFSRFAVSVAKEACIRPRVCNSCYYYVYKLSLDKTNWSTECIDPKRKSSYHCYHIGGDTNVSIKIKLGTKWLNVNEHTNATTWIFPHYVDKIYIIMSETCLW